MHGNGVLSSAPLPSSPLPRSSPNVLRAILGQAAHKDHPETSETSPKSQTNDVNSHRVSATFRSSHSDSADGLADPGRREEWQFFLCSFAMLKKIVSAHYTSHLPRLPNNWKKDTKSHKLISRACLRALCVFGRYLKKYTLL